MAVSYFRIAYFVVRIAIAEYYQLMIIIATDYTDCTNFLNTFTWAIVPMNQVTDMMKERRSLVFGLYNVASLYHKQEFLHLGDVAYEYYGNRFTC